MKNINKKVLLASLIGTSLEFYEFVVYGFLAPIMSPLFFPSTDSFVSLVSGLGVFALGFFARPIGGIIFGYIGDSYGRKKALAFSISLMSIPTCLIGLLPTYATIGWVAPLLLIVCRLLQGICTGGEYNGAGIFLVEHTKNGKKGFASGFLIAGCVIGTFLGSSMSFLVHFFDLSWRWPFLLGIIPGVVGYYIRVSLKESPVFEEAKKTFMPRTKINLVSALRAGGIASCAASLFYFLFIFCNSFIPQVSAVRQDDIIIILTVASIAYLVFLIVLGWISDYVGHTIMMKCAALTTILFIYPAFSYLVVGKGIAGVVVFLFAFSFLLAAYVAPSHAVMVNFFPVTSRYSRLSLSYTIGLSLFGGTAPMFSMMIFRELQIPSSSTFFVLFCAILGFFSVYKLPYEENLNKFRRRLRRLNSNQTNALSPIKL